VKERNIALKDHYHVLLLLNRDTYHCLGDFAAEEGNMAARIKKAWASALGCDQTDIGGLVHFPKNPVYCVDANSGSFEQEYQALFHRVSYFAKAETKNYGDRSRAFGCSRQ